MTRYLIIMILTLNISTQAISQETHRAKDEIATTPGVRVSQLATTDIKRINLSFKLKHTNDEFNTTCLTANLSSFISNKKKQINIYGSAGLAKSTDSYSELFSLSQNPVITNKIGINAKFFNDKNQFLEFGINASSSYYSSQALNIAQGSSQFRIGLGKGRVDFVDDASIVSRVLGVLQQKGELLKPLSESELIELKDLVAEIKNRRLFLNRSYSDSEVEEIVAFIEKKGAIKSNGMNKEMIKQQFEYEPMFARTTGSQYKFSLYSQFDIKSINDDSPPVLFTLGAEISFQKNKYINDKWQLNTSTALFAENKTSNNQYGETFNLKRAGIRTTYNLSYQINNKSSLRFSNTLGYTPLNEVVTYDGERFETKNVSTAFIQPSLNYEFMINRRTAVNFGLNLGISKTGTNSGLSFGVRF